MKAFIKQVISLVLCSDLFHATTIDISLYGPPVCTTRSTPRRLILSDRRKATLIPLWLSQVLRVARVANGEPAGAHFATQDNR